MKWFRVNMILLLFSTSVFCQINQDRIEIKNWIVDFFDFDSIWFPNYFQDQEKIDSISSSYSNWHLRAIAIEEYQLEKYKPNIQINGNSRVVKLENGKLVTLVPDNLKEEAGYTFEKEFDKFDLLLFRAQWFEGNNYFLLDTQTGLKTYTIGRVYFSESGRYLMSINDDIEAGYSDNGFQLFQIGPNGHLHELWKFSPEWAPVQLKWIDDTTLYVKGYIRLASDDWGQKSIYKKMKIHER